MSASRLSSRGRWNTIIVVLRHAVLVGVLAWQIRQALADSGAPSIGNLARWRLPAPRLQTPNGVAA